MFAQKPFPQRKRIRLSGSDYSSEGAYFVSIASKYKNMSFGNISDGEMIGNTTGKMVINAWRQLEQLFSYIQPDEYCLMPVHFHGIIFILGNTKETTTDANPDVEDSQLKIKPFGQSVGVFKTISTKH